MPSIFDLVDLGFGAWFECSFWWNFLDVCDFATSMYHLLSFQLWDTFLNCLQKYGVQHEFMADYESNER